MCVFHRFFFAVKPCSRAAEQTDCFRRSLGPGVPVDQDRLHATFWTSEDHSSFPDRLVERALAAGSVVSAAPFPFALNRVNTWERSIALRPERASGAARGLARELGRQTLAHGQRCRPNWRFNLHVTLLYARREPFASDARSIEPILWYAHDFVLIHSVIGEHRHIELGRWPLTGPAPPEQLLLF